MCCQLVYQLRGSEFNNHRKYAKVILHYICKLIQEESRDIYENFNHLLYRKFDETCYSLAGFLAVYLFKQKKIKKNNYPHKGQNIPGEITCGMDQSKIFH